MSQSNLPIPAEESAKNVASNTDLSIRWGSIQLPESALVKCPSEKETTEHLAIEVEFSDDNTGERVVTLGIFVCKRCANLHTRQYRAVISAPEQSDTGDPEADQ